MVVLSGARALQDAKRPTRAPSPLSASRQAGMTETALAPQYDPTATESSIYARWSEAGLFQPRENAAPSYVIVIPPPNVTDILHMGHGLNNTVQDLLIRFERMRGKAVLWLPGTDHAAIATHNVIERQLAKEGKTRFDIGREAFLRLVDTYQREKGGRILEQLKALGASCDWSRTRFTLDAEYSRAVRHTFVTLYREGLIYRGHRVIHWCPRCLTALSDEEAEFSETEGKLYYIRYPLVDPAGRAAPYVVVATTRPETMLGDVAIAVHPDNAKTKWATGKRVQLPLTQIALAVVPDLAVDPEFGTGFVKVTPAHDATDFEIGQRFQFPMPTVMGPDGRMQDPGDPVGRRVPAELEGVDRTAARERVVALLRQQGLLEKIEPHHHAVRRCYRCGTLVEPRLSDQWFVKMQPLAQRALREFRRGRLSFVPERWGGVYENWLTQIRDWNISRQIWFGHRIPAWYCPDGHITVSDADVTRCGTCGKPARQDEDVLDTWFSSGLWPFATLGWPEHTEDLERFYPGNTLVTAPEIIFFWVARMVMLGYHFLDERPFETVVLTGTVRDAQHRKMSKSAGNGIDPLDVIRRFGADALRFTVMTAAPLGTDIMLDPEDLETSFAPGRNFANKLWNAGRLILPHLEAGRGGKGGNGSTASTAFTAFTAREQLELADRWILSRTQRAIQACTEALEKCRLSDAANAAYHFVWDEVADWYLEQVKPRLYGQAPGGDAARQVLAYVFETALRLLHPVMPFITEQLWSHLPETSEPLLAGAAWPAARAELLDPLAEERFGRVQALVTAVRSVRAEYGVPPSRAVRAVVQAASPAAGEAFQAERQTIERLAKVAGLTVDGAAEAAGGSSRAAGAAAASHAGAHAVLPDGSAVFVPLADAIDVRKECERLGRERERLDRQLEALAAKLANQQFIGRAPADVVERERAKERSWREQREALVKKLGELGC
jgi:valyl-tRNA synthetase